MDHDTRALARRRRPGLARLVSTTGWTGLLVTLGMSVASPAWALDLRAMWDYARPELSEQRFMAALDGASPDERLVLRTQIARTHGLRRQFAQAREVLAGVEPALAGASPEVRVRYHLELGRSLASAAHPPEQLTPQALAEARQHFLTARDLATAAQLDDLAIDALHMMPFVDTAPERQLAWNREALALLERSTQPDAKRWEGSLRNNIGVALKMAGEPEAALEEFRLSREAYLRQGRLREVRYADWMIGWTERSRGRLGAALEIQRRLEREWDAAGEPDADVYEELQEIYTALGDPARAAHYRARMKEAR